MKSKYAPAKRDPIDLVREDFIFINNIEYIEKIMNSLPYLGAILNDKRQIVFSNDKLLEMFELSSIENILGLRHGELLNCVNVDLLSGGCGTSEKCSTCGIVKGILEAQKRDKKVVVESRLSTIDNGVPKAYDYKVTAAPFEWNNKKYYVLSLVDISDEKRRKALERIFFHDVINKTGSMYGFIDLLKIEKDPERIHQFIYFLDLINKDLSDEILIQRDLLTAENGELKVNNEKVNSLGLIENSKNQISMHEAANNKDILLDPQAESFVLTTDGVILRRILMNMLKNALEASQTREIIHIGCNESKSSYKFWVHNNSIMSEETKYQVFQRSFSTKSVNRGLGTYSMKLLGEKYLKGKVGFTSKAGEGTYFFIELPKL
jgi:signal transduction histidine kinase